MEGSRRLSVMVGGFVIVCLALFAAAILSLSKESGIFRPQYELVAHFDNVQGLLPGAPVWLAGKNVGRIESVRLESIGVEHPVRVVMRIRREIQDRVRTDSVATVGTIGVLGDAYVELSVGSLEAQPLGDGDEIRAESPTNLNEAMAKGALALDNIATLAANLNGVVEGFAKREGGEKAAQAMEAASDIMLEVEKGDGLLHSLVYDTYSGGGVKSIEHSLATLENLLVEVKDGEGILHSLIYDSPRDQDLVMEALEAGARLNSILAKVDRGEGTLGLLVSDPSLYEDLKTLLGGAQRSAVVRSLIRMSVEGGP
jgi:phospholipid/cholesterol/gamma-HCH transport system substrate-binding protein